jgi:hypothetical protein
MRLTSLIGILILIFGFSIQPEAKRVSLHMVNKTLKNGKVVTVESDIYYEGLTRKMLTRFTRPSDYILITSSTGESKIFNPTKNEVQLLQHDFLKTGNNLLYFFFTNQIQNLGMKEAGYTLIDTHKENGSLLSTFHPTNQNKTDVSKVVMVHENFAPIYAAFYNTKGWISRKIYYSDYHTYENFLLPGRITEISFTNPQDSIITRTIFSDVKTGRLAVSEFFEFDVPGNAKVVK